MPDLPELQLLSSHRCFEGWQNRYRHVSRALRCEMNFSIYFPPVSCGQENAFRIPAVYWLSGLTCTDENFALKAGAQRVAAELGIALVMPDTSPRGEGVADNEDYDLGFGASFYVNATQEPWRRHYCMYDYVVDELPALIEQHFSIDGRRSISGHSMGGHGALMIALRNPRRYRSVSAFSPVVNPAAAPWGQKAFSHYLSEDRKTWWNYDSTLLVAAATPADHLPMLIDQGEADEFLGEQLKIEAFIAACESAKYPVEINMRKGYNHSYFFISTFIDNHLRFHAKALLASSTKE